MEFKDLVDLKESGADHPYAYKAVFMSGGPGSGKTYWAERLFFGLGFSFANSDKIQELLAKTRNVVLEPQHPEFEPLLIKAKRLSEIRASSWIQNGTPLVIDITGRNKELVTSLNHKLIQAGYDTGMIFVHSDLERAIERNRSRDRKVDNEFLIQAWNDAQRNRYYFNELFGDSYTEFHTDENRFSKSQILDKVIGKAHLIRNPIGRKKILDIVNNSKQPTRNDY
jgi:predicted kinase